MTYLVMETHQSYCVLLDEEGRFLKAANMGYQAGQRIREAVLFREAKPPAASRASLAAWAAAACLLFAFAALWRADSAIAGSVYLSINPGIRMDVNRKDKVVALEGLNPDGAALAADYSYKRKDMNTAAEELVDRAIQMGYLHPGGEIVIELSGEDSWEQTAGQCMEERLESHLAGKLEANVIFGDEPAPPPAATPAPTVPQQIVIEIPATPSPTPSSKPAPEPAPTQRVTSGSSGYGTSDYGGTGGYDGNSGYGGNSDYGGSGYGGGSSYDGGS